VIPGTDTIIDLSHWNLVNSFPDIKASGVTAIIHKCSQGVAIDPAYATRRSTAIPCGLLWGAYHFGVASYNPVKQADFFLSMSYRPAVMALDWEWNNADTMSADQAATFINRIHFVTGRWPMLYTSAAFLTTQHVYQQGGRTLRGFNLISYLPGCLANCDLWLSGFTPQPVMPSEWNKWTIWQHGIGDCAGVDGQCDRDTFNGPPKALAAYFNGDTGRSHR
jgi:lysozyme